jgi:5-methylcytosine-specific restriction enzyme A
MTLRFCLHCNTHHNGACPNKERRRGSAAQRGYGPAWQRLAARAKAAQPWCTHCHSSHDLTVDHIDPSSKHKRLSLNDVQVLCRSCNSSKGGRRGGGVTTEGLSARPRHSDSGETPKTDVVEPWIA